MILRAVVHAVKVVPHLYFHYLLGHLIVELRRGLVRLRPSSVSVIRMMHLWSVYYTDHCLSWTPSVLDVSFII